MGMFICVSIYMCVLLLLYDLKFVFTWKSQVWHHDSSWRLGIVLLQLWMSHIIISYIGQVYSYLPAKKTIWSDLGPNCKVLLSEQGQIISGCSDLYKLFYPSLLAILYLENSVLPIPSQCDDQLQLIRMPFPSGHMIQIGPMRFVAEIFKYIYW